MNLTDLPMYERLCRYIRNNDVSRKLIAINCGISQSQLSLLLSGKRRLTVDCYERLCRAMAVDPRKFYAGGEGNGIT